jgi:hypothetical protein
MTYRAPVADISFALNNAAGFASALAEGLYGDLAADVVQAVLTEAGKFATDVLAPLNVIGDHAGARFKDGAVTTAPETEMDEVAHAQSLCRALRSVRGHPPSGNRPIDGQADGTIETLAEHRGKPFEHSDPAVTHMPRRFRLCFVSHAE